MGGFPIMGGALQATVDEEHFSSTNSTIAGRASSRHFIESDSSPTWIFRGNRP